MDLHVVAGHEARGGGGEPRLESHGRDDESEQDLTGRAERQFPGPRRRAADESIHQAERGRGRPDREPRDFPDGIARRQERAHKHEKVVRCARADPQVTDCVHGAAGHQNEQSSPCCDDEQAVEHDGKQVTHESSLAFLLPALSETPRVARIRPAVGSIRCYACRRRGLPIGGTSGSPRTPPAAEACSGFCVTCEYYGCQRTGRRFRLPTPAVAGVLLTSCPCST